MTVARPLPLAPVPAFLAAAAALGAVALWILGSAGYAARPEVVAPALAVDLVVGLPLLGWLLLVRTGRADAIVLAPLAVVGMLLARWWIPEAHLQGSAWALAPVLVLEGLLVATLVFRARAVGRAYRDERGRHPYRRDAVRAAVARVLGARPAALVTGEAEALVYVVTGWRRPRPPGSGAAFPGHRRGGYPAILGALLLALAAETAVVHLVVAHYAEPLAWVLTALGIYSGMWLVGDLHAARHNPILLAGDTLHLRAGLRWQADVPLSRVRSLRREAPSGGAHDTGAVNFVLFGSPDLWLELDGPVVVQGPFGIRRRTSVVGVGVDDPQRFAAALEERGAGSATS